jgi:hypothetical protein
VGWKGSTGVVLFGSLFLVGCGTTSASTMTVSANVSNVPLSTAAQQTTENNTPTGFLYNGQNAVMFIEWTNSNGSISGQFQEVYSPQPTVTQVYNSNLTGTVNGSSVTVQLQQSNSTLTGTLTSNELVLSVPNQDGTMTSLTFQPGSVNDYNTDVMALKQKVLDAALKTNLSMLAQSVAAFKSNTGYFPTWDSTTTQSMHIMLPSDIRSGKISGNQPTKGTAGQIDFNSEDDNLNDFTPGYPQGWITEKAKLVPIDGQSVYYGVTASGQVFATMTPPDKAPDDENGANTGSTGDGQWTQENIKVWYLDGGQLQNGLLSDIDKYQQ